MVPATCDGDLGFLPSTLPVGPDMRGDARGSPEKVFIPFASGAG